MLGKVEIRILCKNLYPHSTQLNTVKQALNGHKSSILRQSYH